MAASSPLADQLGLRVFAADPAAQAREAVLSHRLVCVSRFKLAVDRMLIRIQEYREGWLDQVHLLNQEREKALEAQTDLLGVSAGQLAACVVLGRAAVVSGVRGRVWEAVQTAKAMGDLLAVPTRLCTHTHSTVLCDLTSALSCLEEGTRLQHFEIDAVQASVSGGGLAFFAKAGTARNGILVTCRDTNGVLADWATLADADVGMTVNGVVWQVAGAVLTEPGVVQLSYAVEEEGADEVEVGVSLHGVAVPGGPWRAHAGFMAKGVHIATLPLLKTHVSTECLAISSDGRLMVVSNSSTSQLDVYRTEDGSHARSFGDGGTDPGKFDGIRGLCVTAHATVLVAEWYNKRIQEVTLEGEHVNFIPVDGNPRDLAVLGDVVAAIISLTSIGLYSYTTGALIRRIEPVEEERWIGICFAPDGKHLAVGGLNTRITLVSVEDGFVRHISPKGYWTGVMFTCTGDVMGLDVGGVSVFSATDGTRLWSWGGGDRVNYVTALAVSGNRLYVLDGRRVHVFE